MGSGESLRVVSGGSGLRALLLRARGLDGGATVRFRQLGEAVDCFVTTPFQVLVSRRVVGLVSRDGAVAGVSAVLDALEVASTNNALDLGAAQDAQFPGVLPPASGFVLVDVVPVGVVRELADRGRALARQFSGPLGPPASLLDQAVLTVSGGGLEVEVPMRVVFACTALQLIPGADAPEGVPRELRVSSVGRWLRVDAPFGSAYFSSVGFSLADRLV